MTVMHNDTHTLEQFLRSCMLGVDFLLVLCVFHVDLGHFVLVLLAFVLLCLVSSILSQEIGWEERRLRN